MHSKHGLGGICGCGSCEDAVYRATQFAAKMAESGECQIFLLAVLHAMQNIRNQVAESGVRQMTDEGGALQAMEFIAKISAIFAAVDKEQSNPKYTAMLNESIDKLASMIEQEQKLPKGD